MISSQQAQQTLRQQLLDIKDRLMVGILEAIESAFAFDASSTPALESTWQWEPVPSSSFDEFLTTMVVSKEDPAERRTVKQHLSSLHQKQIEEFLRGTDQVLLPNDVTHEFFSAVASGHKRLLMNKSAKPLKVVDTLRALALTELKEKAGNVELRSYFPEPLMMKKVDIEYCLSVMNTVQGFTFYSFPQVQKRSKSLVNLDFKPLPPLKAPQAPEPTFLANTRLMISQLVDLGAKSLNREKLEAALAREEAT
eukprot:CAMPEP_0204902602 /NCGR_PEP_ID=MMETSP1397-20131031/3770_1 /ASSEMBLY_ACC=CAM_ASM_000891 /TAXON_ID=49980 /ORGANISM="Climacostomum Climacostomum virens, Strain Stock W-24" /LENGTH=251 /DNA_ID=CAMNT_0052071133 /DNA_START=543 /DNA_END=1295 /DNA_ORIENTATION=+